MRKYKTHTRYVVNAYYEESDGRITVLGHPYATYHEAMQKLNKLKGRYDPEYLEIVTRSYPVRR